MSTTWDIILDDLAFTALMVSWAIPGPLLVWWFDGWLGWCIPAAMGSWMAVFAVFAYWASVAQRARDIEMSQKRKEKLNQQLKPFRDRQS